MNEYINGCQNPGLTLSSEAARRGLAAPIRSRTRQAFAPASPSAPAPAPAGAASSRRRAVTVAASNGGSSTLRIRGTAEQIRARLPASIASVAEPPSAAGEDPQTERWLRVELRAERLDWLPPVLASLDRPFVIERPDELRSLVIALADRLATSARRVHLTHDGSP